MNYQGKMFFGVALLSALLAGCASTDSDSSGQAGDGMSTYVDKKDTSSSYQTEVDPASLATVFYFDFDQATLDAKTRGDLDAQIARLKKTTGPIRLEGHADERGTREYNIALGERRANAVADYMAINGIPRYRIETVSYGEERPAAFGQSDSSYAKNRRVELK
ncbi:OmpA family protein [Spongiibacter taiwanensis]|uniref:OmpA family protein n=1 Tax=Spongiibacter taiwanensis TaxID=1748242 RepID=UPI002034DF41|nr:OmpA family protein [Spongiibacter taiwanensis]USA44082.1 OmpA family protein [Spongiibacter taiwanensis]